MRVQQPLVTGLICVLTSFGFQCARIEQSIGAYSVTPALGSGASASGSTGAAGVAGLQSEAGTTTSAPMAAPDDLDALEDAATANECNAVSSEAVRRRVDLYVVADAYGTALPWVGLWDYMNTGLKSFVSDPSTRGIGVGLRYYGMECEPAAYEAATVEIDSLPAHQAALVRAIDESTELDVAPIGPALQGGIDHQLKRSELFPDVRQVVVLITGGFTLDLTCTYYSPRDVENIAATGFLAAHSIASYVVALGVSDTTNPIATDVIEGLAPLEPIAAAGGTKQAIKVDYRSEPSALHAALDTVRRDAQPCEYAVPPGTDPSLLNFSLTAVGRVPRVADAASCGDGSGYFLDSVATPSWIELCPADCDRLRGEDSTAYLELGCDALTR